MRTLVLALAASTLLSGCIVTAPVKAVGKTAEFAGKGVYYTGKGVYKTGEAVAKTGYYAGKGMFLTGKGVVLVGYYAGYTAYQVGRVPVIVTDAALDTTYDVLLITEKTIDLAGKAYNVYKEVPRSQLQAYIKALKTAKNVAEVIIDKMP